MKKNLFVALCLLGAMPAFAGLPEAPVAAVVPTPAEVPCTLTLQYGIMHTDFDETVGPNPAYNARYRTVPSVLYGFSIGAQWKIAENEKYSQHVGASIGYYTGSQEQRWQNWRGDYTIIDTTVDAYPILLTYNLEYKVNDKLSIYGGVRGGAIVRDTSIKGLSVGDEISDTVVTPMLSVGVGARTFITEKLSFDLGYDFGFSFGEDCGLSSSDGLPPWAASAGSDCRYYGTIKAGFSYSF